MKKIILLSVFGFVWGLQPSLNAAPGQIAFQQKCAACHTIGEGARVGPDLSGVTERREKAWLIHWITQPDKVIQSKDPIALELLKQFNNIPMPNLAIGESEAGDILAYIAEKSKNQKAGVPASSVASAESSSALTLKGMGRAQKAALGIFVVLGILVVIVFLRIAASTRHAVATIDMKTAYKLRRKIFIVAALLVLGVLGATLPRAPYPHASDTPDRVVYVTARQFSFIFSSEPIVSQADTARIAEMQNLEIAKNALVEFRVTSLDVNHDFALYNSEHSIIAQTQAMPGYVNRLRVRFAEPGAYNVLCLEYCGAAHHLMRSALTVK